MNECFRLTSCWDIYCMNILVYFKSGGCNKEEGMDQDIPLLLKHLRTIKGQRENYQP